MYTHENSVGILVKWRSHFHVIYGWRCNLVDKTWSINDELIATGSKSDLLVGIFKKTQFSVNFGVKSVKIGLNRKNNCFYVLEPPGIDFSCQKTPICIPILSMLVKIIILKNSQNRARAKNFARVKRGFPPRDSGGFHMVVSWHLLEHFATKISFTCFLPPTTFRLTVL